MFAVLDTMSTMRTLSLTTGSTAGSRLDGCFVFSAFAAVVNATAHLSFLLAYLVVGAFPHGLDSLRLRTIMLQKKRSS